MAQRRKEENFIQNLTRTSILNVLCNRASNNMSIVLLKIYKMIFRNFRAKFAPLNEID